MVITFAASNYTHMENFDWVRDLCTSLPMVTEEFPFDAETLVFKVSGKMFCLGDVGSFESIGLKCDPAYALELREQYPQITTGPYLDKKHWNYAYFDGMSMELIKSLILHSYDLVVQKLPKKIQSEIQQLRA